MSEPQTQTTHNGRFGIDTDPPAHERIIKSIEATFPQNKTEAFRQLAELEHNVAGNVFKADLGRINSELLTSGLLRGPNGDMEIVGDHGNFRLAAAVARTAAGAQPAQVRLPGVGRDNAVTTGQTTRTNDTPSSDLDQLFESAGPGSLRPKFKAPERKIEAAPPQIQPAPAPSEHTRSHDPLSDPLALPRGWAPRTVPHVISRTPALEPPPVPTERETAPVRQGPSPNARDTSGPAPAQTPPIGQIILAPFTLIPNLIPHPDGQPPQRGKNGPPTWPAPFSGSVLPGPDATRKGPPGLPGDQLKPLMPFPLDPIFKGLNPGWSQPQEAPKRLPSDGTGSRMHPVPEAPAAPEVPKIVPRPSPVKERPVEPPLGIVPSDWKAGDIQAEQVKEGHLEVYATGFTKAQGGPNDRLLRKNYTLQDYVNYQKRLARGENVPRDQQVPYISLAMDDQNGIQDGQLVRIPSLEKLYGMPLKFRVTDTGSAFTNRNFDKVDVNVDTNQQAYDITTHRDVYFMKESGDQERLADLKFAADHHIPESHPSRARHPQVRPQVHRQRRHR